MGVGDGVMMCGCWVGCRGKAVQLILARKGEEGAISLEYLGREFGLVRGNRCLPAQGLGNWIAQMGKPDTS